MSLAFFFQTLYNPSMENEGRRRSTALEAAERKRAILEHYRRGFTVRETAEALGYHPSWVGAVIRGEPRRPRPPKWAKAPEGKTLIYGLRGSDGVRYIGQTTISLGTRFSYHKTVTSRKNTAFGRWLRDQIAAGTLEIFPIKTVGINSWKRFETAEICRQLAGGAPLLNTWQTTPEGKTDPAVYDNIRRLYASGKHSLRELGSWFGMSGQRVSQIVQAAKRG